MTATEPKQKQPTPHLDVLRQRRNPDRRRFRRLQKAATNITNMRSENAAGVISLAGSTGLALSGDPSSIAATAAFTGAEVTMAVWGHTKAGYSASAAMFATGDFLLATSPAVAGEKALVLSLQAMGVAWSAGAMRYPLDRLSSGIEADMPKLAEHLKNIEAAIPPTVGTVNLALRVPGAASAAAAENWIVLGAIGAWGTADVLANRLQDTVSMLTDKALENATVRDGAVKLGAGPELILGETSGFKAAHDPVAVAHQRFGRAKRAGLYSSNPQEAVANRIGEFIDWLETKIKSGDAPPTFRSNDDQVYAPAYNNHVVSPGRPAMV